MHVRISIGGLGTERGGDCSNGRFAEQRLARDGCIKNSSHERCGYCTGTLKQLDDVDGSGVRDGRREGTSLNINGQPRVGRAARRVCSSSNPVCVQACCSAALPRKLSSRRSGLVFSNPRCRSARMGNSSGKDDTCQLLDKTFFGYFVQVCSVLCSYLNCPSRPHTQSLIFTLSPPYRAMLKPRSYWA